MNTKGPGHKYVVEFVIEKDCFQGINIRSFDDMAKETKIWLSLPDVTRDVVVVEDVEWLEHGA